MNAEMNISKNQWRSTGGMGYNGVRTVIRTFFKRCFSEIFLNARPESQIFNCLYHTFLLLCLLALLTYTTCFRGPPGTTHQNELFRVITVYTHTAMVISFFIGIMVMFMVMVSG